LCSNDTVTPETANLELV